MTHFFPRIRAHSGWQSTGTSKLTGKSEKKPPKIRIRYSFIINQFVSRDFSPKL